ncbi:MAG: recombinase family protein, partial [Chloroflexi bacterium]|nr:recombinase family protein [Chloroflexota bacterium]
EAGKFDIVVVHTLDRWARNLKVMLETLSFLGQHNVGFISITENLDYTTPHGKLTTQMLGGMAEFFSDMLAVHTKKGISERARQGKQLGSIPFGYESCRVKQDGVRILQCKPEHPGGIHVHTQEGPAIAKLFKDYAAGSTTLSVLATWLNGEEFRTRNTKRLLNAAGELVAEPRLFTTASVRGILHNSTYTDNVRHGADLYPGLHEALVSQELFQVVQDTLKKNSGRSETLQAKPTREYLLKGLVRCAYCKMPMWAQTYRNGNRYYREQHGSRGAGNCVNKSGSIRCEVPDEQMGMIMGAIILPDSWMDRLLARIQLADEVKLVNRERKKIESHLK